LVGAEPGQPAPGARVAAMVVVAANSVGASSAAAATTVQAKEKREKALRAAKRAQAPTSAPAKPKGAMRQASLKVFGDDVLPYQETVRQFNGGSRFQQLVAVLIGLNFFTNAMEKEIDVPGVYEPYPQKYPVLWQNLEDVFNVVFLCELLINLYGNWWCRFWRSSWNVFDVIVVTVGVLSLMRLTEGPLGLLRMLRAFRVFRLFKRVKSLNKIIVALGRAIPGVTNAFIIMIIFTAIYAMLAVEFFHGFGADGEYVNMYTNVSVSAITGRGMYYGKEYFGSFSRAFYTMWQVLTGESWSEAVVRPLLFGWNEAQGLSSTGVALFFVSFLIICAIVLINVVVAVLLEKMVEEDPEEGEEDEEEEQDDVLLGGEKDNHHVRVHPAPVESTADPVQPMMAVSEVIGPIPTALDAVSEFHPPHSPPSAPPDGAGQAQLEARLTRLEAKLDSVLSLLQSSGGLTSPSGVLTDTKTP